MSSTPEKVPLMTRVDRRLEKHGLSFGDALNIALFALTIASLWIAILAIEDARKAAKDQDTQFQEQMKQLKASSEAMQTASKLLGGQGDILRDLQNVSRQQLKDLNAAEARVEKRENAKPKPEIQVECNGKLFLDVLPSDIAQAGDQPFARTGSVPDPFPDHHLSCIGFLRNSGDADLKNARLGIYVELSDDIVITSVNGSATQPGESFVVLVSGVDVPPESRSNRSTGGGFELLAGRGRKQFNLQVSLESDNFKRVLCDWKVNLEQAPALPSVRH